LPSSKNINSFSLQTPKDVAPILAPHTSSPPFLKVSSFLPPPSSFFYELNLSALKLPSWIVSHSTQKMEFGLDLVGIEGLAVGQNCSALEQQQVLEGKPKFNGSVSIKQERSDPFEDEGDRATKIAKRADDLGMRSNTENALPKEQMLSFSSSSKPEVSFLSGKDVGLISDKNAQNLAFAYHQQSAYSRSPSGMVN